MGVIALPGGRPAGSAGQIQYRGADGRFDASALLTFDEAAPLLAINARTVLGANVGIGAMYPGGGPGWDPVLNIRKAGDTTIAAMSGDAGYAAMFEIGSDDFPNVGGATPSLYFGVNSASDLSTGDFGLPNTSRAFFTNNYGPMVLGTNTAHPLYIGAGGSLRLTFGATGGISTDEEVRISSDAYLDAQTYGISLGIANVEPTSNTYLSMSNDSSGGLYYTVLEMLSDDGNVAGYFMTAGASNAESVFGTSGAKTQLVTFGSPLLVGTRTSDSMLFGTNGTKRLEFGASGGATWATYQEFGSGGPTLRYGTGSPEGAVTAPVASLFLRTNGSSGAALYVKETGAGNTGWTAFAATPPGGSNTHVQFNNSGAFGGSANLTWNGSALGVVGSVTIGGATANDLLLKKNGSTYLDLRVGNDSAYANLRTRSTAVIGGTDLKFLADAGAYQTGVDLASDFVLGWWSAVTIGTGARDIGLARSAAAVLKVTDGSTGGGALWVAQANGLSIGSISGKQRLQFNTDTFIFLGTDDNPEDVQVAHLKFGSAGGVYDVGLGRASATTAKITNGASGYGDLYLRALATSNGTNFKVLLYGDGQGIDLDSSGSYRWSSGADATATKDAGLARVSAALIKVTDGSTGYGKLYVAAGDQSAPGLAFGVSPGAGIYTNSTPDLVFTVGAAMLRMTTSVIWTGSDKQIGFGSGTSPQTTNIDTGFGRAAARVAKVTDGGSGGGSIAYPAVTPSQITADQNNYNPTVSGWTRLSSDAARNVTGLVAGADGEMRVLANVGSFNITLNHESASSTAANRFTATSAADVTITPGRFVHVIYDATTARWRVSSVH